MIRRRIGSTRDQQLRAGEFLMENSEAVTRSGRTALVITVLILALAALYFVGLYVVVTQ